MQIIDTLYSIYLGKKFEKKNVKTIYHLIYKKNIYMTYNNNNIVLVAFLGMLAAAAASPECFTVGSTLWVTGADYVGAKCYHYVGESTCECASATSYADGQGLVDGWDTVHVNPSLGPYTVNLYSGDVMTFPTDTCCPPPTFLGVVLECETITDLGACCTDGSSTFVSGLPAQADCVHDATTYSAHTPDGSGDTSWGTSTSMVEVYASDDVGGYCGDQFMYAMTCGTCARRRLLRG
jgi:hypothetical protein